MHQKKLSGFIPSSCDQPPIVTIRRSPTDASRTKATNAFISLLEAFSRFGYTTA